MNEIAVEALAPVVWHDAKVITTELLAKVYGASSKQINDNYANNADRFEAGKHYFKLEGDDLRGFKNRPENFGSVGKRARSVILWTERGAARHAKMLDTDVAWDIFEKLEDHYFHKREGDPADDDSSLSTVRDREPLLYAAVTLVVRHRLPFHVVYQTMNHFAGSMKFSVMTKPQVDEVAKFVERFLIGNDTRQDWLRIEANRRAIAGDETQPELIGFVVPGIFGARS